MGTRYRFSVGLAALIFISTFFIGQSFTAATSMTKLNGTALSWFNLADDKAPKNKTSDNFINNGAASTTSTTVRLKIFGKDNVGVTAYHITESDEKPNADDPGWIEVPATKKYKSKVDYTLSEGKGEKTVFVRFKDAAGNISKPKTDTIELN